MDKCPRPYFISGRHRRLAAKRNPREVAPGVVGFRMLFRRADGSLIDQRDYTGYETANPVVAINFGLAVIGKQSLSQLTDDQIAGHRSQVFRRPGQEWHQGAAWDGDVLTSAFYETYLRNKLSQKKAWFQAFAGAVEQLAAAVADRLAGVISCRFFGRCWSST